MKVPCTDIADSFKKYLSKQTKEFKKRKINLKLITFLIGESAEQISFVSIKKKVGKAIGSDFEFIHLTKVPEFQNFANLLKEKSQDPKTTGMIIQQPLPPRLYSETLYNFIASEKEIEGHRPKSPYLPPLGLAVLTILKFVYKNQKVNADLFINPKEDASFLKQVLKNKKIVLAGRGATGGQPIGKVLSFFRINYLNINSRTDNPDQYYKDADIIITAVGKKVITKENIKPGVVLINAGLRREKGKLAGDYDESEIKNIAAYYTTTPGGVGPIDVSYLYKNLLDAASHLE